MIKNNSNNTLYFRILLVTLFLFSNIVLFAEEKGWLNGNDNFCSVWWTGSAYKIMHDDPVPEKKGKVCIQAAKNEFESFQLVLSPKIDIENISVSVAGFANKNGLTIPAGNVTIRKVEYVHIAKPSGIRHKAGWYPDPLPLLEKPFSAKAGMNTPILISVKVPKDAASGVYSAQIILKSAAWETVVPVELKVWNFALPDVPNRDTNNDKTKYLTGPVPSLPLEIMPEGIDDYDYLVLLENCVGNARPDQQKLMKKAKQILNYGPEVFVNEQAYTKNPGVIINYRQQIGNLIEQFKSKQ